MTGAFFHEPATYCAAVRNKLCISDVLMWPPRVGANRGVPRCAGCNVRMRPRRLTATRQGFAPQAF